MTTREGRTEHKGRTAFWVYAAGWLALGLFAAPLLAADPDITIEQLRPKNVGKLELKLRPSLAAIRSDAPFTIELDLDSTFPNLMEGDLELTFVDDGEVRLRLQTGPLAVPNGQQSFRLFLPAMAANQERANFVVRAAFHGPRGPLDLGTHDLVVPLKGQRQFLLAAAGLGDATVNELTRHLGLDTFRPPDAGRSVLLTLPVEFDPHAIPVDPVGLYPFDMLVFAGEYFSRLSARQLDTIAEWVQTGGGVVVVPTGVLTPAHTEFLERLAGRDAKAPRFIPDRFGRLPARKPGLKDWLIACRYGYGRALILQSMPRFGRDVSLMESDAAAWTRAVCFLWNVRPKQTEDILKGGTWQILAPPTGDEPITLAPQRQGGMTRPRVYRARYSEYDDRTPLHPEKFAQADALRALLFPEEVRVVPFRVVAAILTLFLLAIAPADYLILGLLRRRKYTWFVFPALCILFTVATVWVARYYTGTIDHRGALVIVDVGEKGKPLRTTRIEHIITAGTHPISAEVKDGLFAMTDVQPLRSDGTATAASGRLASTDNVGSAEADEPLDYAGTLPSAFTVARLSRRMESEHGSGDHHRRAARRSTDPLVRVRLDRRVHRARPDGDRRTRAARRAGLRGSVSHGFPPIRGSISDPDRHRVRGTRRAVSELADRPGSPFAAIGGPPLFDRRANFTQRRRRPGGSLDSRRSRAKLLPAARGDRAGQRLARLPPTPAAEPAARSQLSP